MTAEVGQGDGLRVVDQRVGGDIELLVRRLIELKDFRPHSEPDVDMRCGGHEGFENVRIRSNNFVGHLAAQSLDSLHRGAFPAKKHGAVECEMQIVDPVQRIEIRRASVSLEFVVDLGCRKIAVEHILIVAAQDIDMRSHVHKMPGIRNQILQPVAMAQSPFRVRRHFHQVNVHVQEPRMIPGARQLLKCMFQNCHGLGVEPSGFGTPVWKSHNCQGVRFIKASA